MGTIEEPGAREVTIALIQGGAGPDTKANLDKAVERIAEAAKKGARIICLPELFKSEYFCQAQDRNNFRLAEAIPGETTDALSKAAKANKVVVIAGVFEKKASGLYYNSAVVIDADGAALGTYRKMHIPEDPVDYHEKMYFTPGDLGFRSFKTAYGNIGVLICWDQWFPEAARLTAMKGAEIIFYPTAIGWSPEDAADAKKIQIDAWETVQRAHGIANGVFIASVNRVGREGNIKFWGSSFVSGPLGEMVAKAGSEKEEILIAKCDLSRVESTREGWPFLRDRRTDAYKDMTSRFSEQ